MSGLVSHYDDLRRKRRHDVSSPIAVVDSMTECVVGRLGNISETGMLLIAGGALVDEALYQLHFDLGGPSGPALPLEVGAHLLWQDEASATGQVWVGMRFINLPEAQRLRLRRWLSASPA